jgi:hypothetical protein
MQQQQQQWQQKTRTTVFTRFIAQKNGLANIVMASCCLALSIQLLQRRDELEAVKRELVDTKRARDSYELEEEKKKKKKKKSGWF